MQSHFTRLSREKLQKNTKTEGRKNEYTLQNATAKNSSRGGNQMKTPKKLYSFHEAYEIGRKSISIVEMVVLEDALSKVYNEQPYHLRNDFGLELAFTAYTAGLLQGKREERQKRKNKASGEVRA